MVQRGCTSQGIKSATKIHRLPESGLGILLNEILVLGVTRPGGQVQTGATHIPAFDVRLHFRV